MRFDYIGSGDSAGVNGQAGEWQGWLDGIDAAIEVVRTQSTVAQIVLVGMRLGVPLAVQVAERRNDVHGIIALDAVIQGKRYLRELRVLKAAADAQDGIAVQDVNGFDCGGLTLSPDTVKAVEDVDLMQIASASVPHWLVINRVDRPAPVKFLNRVQVSSVDLQQILSEDYVGLLQQPHETVIPVNLWSQCKEWLDKLVARIDCDSALGAERRDNPLSAGLRHEAVLASDGVREQVVWLGRERRLFSIVTRSLVEVPVNSGRCLTIVLLTAGTVHRIGPNRVYVSLARQLAAAGHTVIRVDQSGVGDSPARSSIAENVVYSEQSAEDTVQIVESLQLLGFERCVLLGICSGAYHAYRAASAGLGVCGIVLINPLTYRYQEGMSLSLPPHRLVSDVNRYKRNFFRRDSWQKVLNGRVDVAGVSRVLMASLQLKVISGFREAGRLLNVPMHDDVMQNLTKLTQRAVSVQFVFSEFDRGLGVLQGEGKFSLRRLVNSQRIGIEFVPNADHTFTSLGSRQRLIEIVIPHLERLRKLD